jgi:hypothetical protein
MIKERVDVWEIVDTKRGLDICAQPCMSEAIHKAIHHCGTLFMMETKSMPIDLWRLRNWMTNDRFPINVHVQKVDFKTVEVRNMRD